MPHSVLIVDDNPVNLKLAADVLEFAGFHVTRAVDAEDALVQLAKHRPELVLMDIALPGMDGLELTRRLKADPRYSSMLIVALTASAMKGDDHRTFKAGCDGYISKPIDTRALPDQVAGFIRTSRPPGGPLS